jgi:hypothetical protein
VAVGSVLVLTAVGIFVVNVLRVSGVPIATA